MSSPSPSVPAGVQEAAEGQQSQAQAQSGPHPLEQLRAVVQSHAGVSDPAEADKVFVQVIAEVLRLYVAQVADHPELELPENVLSATETAMACIHLLDSAALEVFELAMWKSWSGGPRGVGPAIDNFNPNRVSTSRSRR